MQPFVFSDAAAPETNPAASRTINDETVFYANLNEAFHAFSSDKETSIDNPDEIILLADIILENPVIINENQHVRLVSDQNDVVIHRGENLLEYPIFWIKGNNASLSLGKEEMMQGSIIVDGGYLNDTPIIAKAPIVALSGQYSKFVIYDGVSLQNNCNVSSTEGTDLYRNGAGIYIRTFEGNPENQAEFIMKGGIIQGNFNNTQNPIPFGGAVTGSGFGMFTMEGGIIRNNTAYLGGGGFHIGSRASFKKTGGIIYGKDAPEGLRNIAITGVDELNFYGHALSVAIIEKPFVQYRDDTVDENDNLSYIGAPIGDGVFGEGDNWDNPIKETQKRVMIMLVFALILAVLGFLIIRKSRPQKISSASSTNMISDTNIELSSREKEVFTMLLTDLSIKEIAHTLKISYSGVNFHIKNIYFKLGVQSRAELLVKFSNHN